MHQAKVKNNRRDCIEQPSRKLLRENVSWARKALGSAFGSRAKTSLESLTREFGFSVKGGDLQIINSNWYVTHTGLIGLARRKRCSGIHVEAVDSLFDSAGHRFGLTGNGLSFQGLLRFCRLWRCRPVQRLSTRPRGRDARGRNASRQSRPAQGLRNWSLFGRGDRDHSKHGREAPPTEHEWQ